MSVSVLIPYRPDGAQRDRLWAWTRCRYEKLFPSYEIVVSDDLGQTRWFNRGQARNLAAERATGDVFLIGDADTVGNAAEISAAVASCRSDGRWLIPAAYRQLARGATEAVLRRSPDCPLSPTLESDWVGIGCSVAPILVVPAEAFRQVGGYDERYPGWGSDDAAFQVAMDTLYEPHERWAGDAYHLWHPRTESLDSGAALTLKYLAAAGDAEKVGRLREGHLLR